MKPVEILPFGEKDVPFGLKLTDAEGWHRTREDWLRLLRLEPRGVLKARVGGKDVGVAALIVYDELAWIHSVIVERDHRGLGIGRTLLEGCIRIANRRGVTTLKLDSVQGFEGFYERFGFVREFESRRYLAGSTSLKSRCEPMKGSDLQRVCSFDRAMTGLDRQRAISALYKAAPDMSFVLRFKNRLRGYIMGRPGEGAIQVGPCVAEPDNIGYARELVIALTGFGPGWKYRFCIPSYNVRAVRLAERLGFGMDQSSTRMYRGLPFEESLAEFAMLSPEKG